MITRRDFMIVTSTATASSPLLAHATTGGDRLVPLKATPRVRSLHTKQTEDGRLLFVSDSPDAPPRIIRPAALEKVFGRGAEHFLYQPDHWRMIDEGWFSEDETYHPEDFDDPAFNIWHANYRPETEAHDLLYNLFRDQVDFAPFGSGRVPELGLGFGEHPSTPRFATAKLDGEHCLLRVAAEVATRTSWLTVDLSTADGDEG